MKINKIDNIDDLGGDWLVLTDYGVEGISVTSQHERVEEAILALGDSGSGNQAIVLLPNLTLVVGP